MILAFVIIFPVGMLFSIRAYKQYQEVKNKIILMKKREAAWFALKKNIERKITRFKGDVSVVVKDLDTNWEIDYNKDTLVPAASLVKIPVMLSCYYAAEEGKIHLSDTVSLKGADKVSGSKVLGQKAAGSVFTVEELLGPMITQSDNTATNVLIEFLGFDALNSYFKKDGPEKYESGA